MQKNENIVKAINRNVRSSPRKINLLLKNIRGKKVDTAIRDLSFARQRIAFDIKKTVQAAVANAENNYQYEIDNLYVTEAYVGKSIVLKRFRARAKGRASAIKKPYSNITIILSEKIIKKKRYHMGQKVNPIGFRLGINRGWDSVWFSKKRDYGKLLIEDYKIRE